MTPSPAVQLPRGLYAGAMSTTRIRPAIATLAASALVCSGVLAGCSISRSDQTTTPPASSSSEPTTTTSDEPTATDQPTSQATAEPTAAGSTIPDPTEAPSPTSAATPAGALLTAADLPQLNESSPWAEARTGVPGPMPFGLCQKFDLLSIGAMNVIQRTYTAGSDTAAEQVAEFPDAQNTVRATKVLEAWHRECAGRVEGTHVKVRPITGVAVPQGNGRWYLVSYERSGVGHFHSLGVVVSGNRMSLIRMDHEGQDHNYEPGQDPMELAVKAVAAKL
ncbi:MAG: hypothetical protein JWR64_916 [Marmoricola sp.]|nr:hypothetical protein [Marmoricola sp.]